MKTNGKTTEQDDAFYQTVRLERQVADAAKAWCSRYGITFSQGLGLLVRAGLRQSSKDNPVEASSPGAYRVAKAKSVPPPTSLDTVAAATLLVEAIREEVRKSESGTHALNLARGITGT